MTVIKPNVTLIDRRGVEWRTAPGFQDREPNRPGWLLMRAASGEELGYTQVLDWFGFPRAGGGNFLRGRYDDEPKHRPWLTDDGTRPVRRCDATGNTIRGPVVPVEEPGRERRYFCLRCFDAYRRSVAHLDDPLPLSEGPVDRA